MRLINLLFIALLSHPLVLKAKDGSETCTAFCIRLASYDEKPGYTMVKIHGGKQSVWVSRHVEMGVEIIKRAEIAYDHIGNPAILLYFTASGKQSYGEFAASNLKARIAIFVEGELLTAPMIVARVKDKHILISGRFSKEEAKEYVRKLNENVD